MIGISRNTNFKPEIRPTHRSHVGVRSKFLKIAYGDKTAKNAARLAEHLYSYLVHLASSEARPERFLKLARRRILHVHYFCCKVAHVTNKYNIDDFLKKALVTYVMLELNVLRNADCSQSKEQSEEYRKELTERVLRLLWTIYSKYYFYLTHRMDRTGVWEMIWRFLRKELPSNVPGFFNVIFDDIKKLLPPEPQHPELPYFTEKCYKSKRIDNSADPLYTECRSQGIKIDLSNGQDGTEKGDSEHEDDEPKRRHSRLEIYRNTSDDIIDLTADDVPTVLTGDVPTVPTGDSVISHEPVANNEVSQYGNVLNQARSLLSAVSQLTGRKGVTIRLIGDRVEIDTTQPGSPLEPNHSLRCIDWQRDYEEPAEAQLSLPSNSASNCDNEPPSDKLQLIFRTEDQQPSCKSNYLESSIKTSTQIMSKVCLDPKQKFIRASSEDITQTQKNMSQIQQSDIVKKHVIHSGTPFNECSSGLFENPKITEDRSDSTIAQPPKVVPSLLQSTIDENSATRSLLTVDSLSCKDTLQITEKLENLTPNISDKSQFCDKDNAQITTSREQKSPDAVPSLPQSAVDANSPLSLHFSTPNTVDKCPVNEVTSNDRFGDGDNVQITASKEHISEVVPCLPSGSSNNDDVSCEDYIKNKYAVSEDQSEMILSLPESTVNANSATQSSCVDLSSKNPLQLSDNLTNSTLTRLQFYDEDKSQITASKEQQPSEVAPSSPQSRIDVNSATHQPLSLLTPNTIHKSQVIDPTNCLQFRDHDNSQIAASKDQSSEVVSSLAQSTVDANPAIQSSLSHGNNLSYETNTTPVDKAPSNDQCCDNSQITTSKEQPVKVVPSLTESSLGFSDSDDDLTCKDTFQVPGKLANSTPNIENKNKFGDDYNSQIIASKDEQRSDVAASLSQSSGDANSATQLALSCKADDTLQKIEKLVNSTANITGKFAVNDQTSNNQVDECGNSQITTSKEQPSEEVSSLPKSTVDANSATQSSLLLGSSDDVSDENTLQITGQLVNSPLNTTEKTSINDPDSAEAHNLQTSSSKEQHSGVLPLEPQRQSSLSLGTSDSDKHINSCISSETLQIILSLEEILDKGETSGSQSLEVTSSKDSSSVPEIVNESKESLQEQLQNFAVKEITNVSRENNSKITKNVTSHTSLIKQSFQKVSEECEDNSQICVEDTNLSSNVLLQPSQQSAAEKPDETTNVCIKSSPDCADITNALPSISLNQSSQDAYNEQTCNVLLCEWDSGNDSHLTEEPENATIGNASIEKSCTVQECPVEQEASVEQPTSNEYSELGHPISDNLSHENNDIQHFEQESIVEGTYPIPTTEDISITTSVVNNGSIDVEEQSNKLDEKSQTIEGQRSSQALLKAEIYNFTDELEQAEQSEITANFATLNQGEEMLATTQPNEIATDIAKEKTIAILSDVVITPSGSKVSITDPLKKTKKGKRRFKWCSVNVNIPEQSTREIKLDKLSCEDDDSTKCDNQTSAENSLKPGVEKPIGDRIANRDNLSKTTSKESSLDCSVEKLFSELSAEDLSAPSNSAVEAKAEDEIAYQDHTAISAENFNTPLTDGAADRQVGDKLSHHDNFEIGARDSDSPSNISKSSLQEYLSDFAVEISAEDLKVPPRKSSQCEDNLQKSKDRADEKKIVQLSGEDKLQITTGMTKAAPNLSKQSQQEPVNIPEQSTREIKLNKLSCEDDVSTKCDNQTCAENSPKPGVEKPIGDTTANRDNISKATSKESSLDCSVEKLFSELSAEDLSAPSNSAVEAKAEDEIAYQDHTTISAENFNTPLSDGAADRQVGDKLSHHDNFEIGARDSDSPSNISKLSLQKYLSDFAVEISAEDLKVPPRKSSQCEDNLQKSKDRADEKKIVQLSGEDKLQITTGTPVDKAPSNDQCCDNSQITTSKEQPLKVVPSLTESSLGFSDSDDDLTCKDTFQVPGKLANSTPNIENKNKFGDDYNSQIIASKDEQRSDVAASLSQSSGDANSATQLALSCKADDTLQKIEKLVNSTANITGKFAVNDQTSNNQVDECGNSQITTSKGQPSEEVSSLPKSTVDANSATQSSLLLGSSDDVSDENTLQITGQLVNSPLNTTEKTSINDTDSAEAHNLQDEDVIAYQDRTAISAENFNTPLSDGAADRQVGDKLSHHDNFEISARDSDSPSNISKLSLQTYLSDFAVEISAEDLKVPPRKSSQCEDNLQKSKDRADEKKIVQLSGEDKLQITTGMTKAAPNLSKQSQQEPVNIPEQSTRVIKLNKLSCEDDVSTKCDNQTCAENSPKPGVEKPIGDTTANRDNISKATSKESSLDCSVEKLFSELSAEDLSAPSNSAVEAKAEDEIAYQDLTAISVENFNTPLSEGAADRQVGDKLSHHDNFEIGARDSDSPSNISKSSLQTYLSDFAVEISAEDLKVPPRKSSRCEDSLQKSKDRADEKKIVQLSGEDKLQITTGMTKAAPNLSKQSQQEPVNIPEQSTREIKLNKLSCEDDVSTKCDNQTCAENSPKAGVEKPIGDTTANRDNISKVTSKESSLDCSVEKLFSELSVEDLSAPSNSAVEAKAEGEIPYQDHTSISAENFNAPLSDDAADQQVGDKLSHHDNFEIGGSDSDSPSNISKSSLQKYLSDFAVEISAEDLKVPPRKSSQYEDNLQKSKDRADEKKIVQLSGEDKLQITTEITKAAPNLSKQSQQEPNKELPCEDDLQIIDREVKEIFDNPCESKSQKTPTATKASRRKLKKYSKSLKIGNKYIDEDNSHVTAETSQCAVEEPTLNKLPSEGNTHIKMENVSTNSSKPSSQEHVMKEATYTTPNKETTYSITKILQKSSPDCTAKEIPAEVKNATTPNQSFGEEIEKSISDQDKAQITTDVTKASPHKLKQSSRRSSLRPVKKRAGNTLSSEDIVQITAAVTKASPSISYSAKKQTIYKRRPSDSVNLSKNIPYQSTEECIGNEHDGSNSPNINITSPGEYNCEDNSNLTVVTSKLEQNENKLYCEDDSQLMPVITTLPTNISVSQKNVDSDSLITANSSITISNEQTIACEGSPEEVKNLALNISTQRSPVYSQGKEVCSYENSEIVISRKNIAMKENIPQIIEDVPDLSLAVLDDTLKDQSDCADNSQISEEIANLFLENQSLHLPLAPQEFPCEDNLQIGAEIILTAHDSYLTEEPEVASIEMPCTVQECPVEQEASVEQLTSNEYSELGDNLSHENNDIQHFEQECIVEGTYPIPTTEDVSIINNNESIDVEEQSNKVDEKIQTIGQRSSQALLKAEICNFTDELEQAEQNELTSNFATLNQDEEILAATQGNEIATNIAKEKAITVLSEVIITPSCSKVSITDPLKKTTEGKRRFKWCSVNAEDKSSINNSGESYLNEDPLLIPMDAAQSHSPEEQAVEPVSLPSTIGCLNEDNFRNMKNDEMVVYVEGYPSYTQKQLTTILKDTTREHGNPKEDYIDKVRSSSDKASDDVLNLRSTSSQLHNNCYVRVSNVFAEPQNMVLNMSNNNAGLLDSQPCPKNKLMELADIALGQGGSETTDESEVTRIEDAVPKSPSKKSKSVFSSTPNQYKTKAELKFLGDPSDDDEKPLADRLLKKDTTSETSKPYSNKKTQPSTPMSGSPNKRGSKSTANKKEKSPGRKPRVKPEGSKQQRISKDTKGKKFNNSNTTYTSKLRPRSQTISEKEKVNEEIVTAATPKPRSRKASTNSKESGTKTPKTLKQSLEDVPLINSEFTNTKEGNKVPKAVKQSVDKCVKAIVKTPSNNASESTINKENNKTPKTVKEVITPTTIISEGSPTKLAFATVPPKKRFLEFLEKKTDPHLVLTTKRLEERQKEKETFTEEKIEISQSSENKMLNKESAIRTDPLPDDLPLSQLKSVLPDDLERDGTIMLSENETKNISNLASDIIDASFGSESCVSDDKEISIPTRLVKTNEFPIDGLKIITKESDEKLCGLSSESTATQIIPEKEHDVSVYTSETSVSVYSTKSSVAVCCSETSVSISSSEASTLIYPSSVSASSMEASVLAYSYEAGQNSKSEDASACLVKENVELISSNKAPVNEDKIKPETKDKIASCENENRDFLLGKIDSECLVREPPLTDNNKSGQQEINSKCVEIVPKEQDLLISGIESNRDALVSENNTHLLVSNETNISKSNIFIESPTSITEAAQASDSDGDLIIDESVDKIAEESDNQLTSKTNEDSGSEIEMKQNYSSRRKNKRTFEGDVHPANKKPDDKERKCSFKKSTPDGNRGIKRAGSETKKSEQFSNKKLKKDKEPKETPRENITSEQHSSSGLGEDVKKSKKEEILSSKQNKELNNAKIVKIPESSSVNANKPIEDENHRSKNVELKNRKQKDSNDKTKRDFSDKNKKSNDEFRRNEKSGGKHKSEKMNEQNKTKLQNTADNKAKEKDENSGGDLRKSKKSKNIPKEKPKKVDDQNKSKLQSTESKDKTKESRRGERSSSRQKEKINDDEQRKIGRSSSKHKDDKRSDQNKIKQTKNENIEGNKVHSKNQKEADSRKIDAEKGSSRIRQSSSKTLECNNRREDLDTKNSLDISQTKKDDEAEKLPIKNAKIASIITDLEKRALIKSPRKSVTFEEKYEQKNEAQIITPNQEDCKATLRQKEKINDDEQRKIGRSSSKHKDDKRSDQNKIKQTKNENIESNKVHSKNQKEADSRKIDAEKGSSRIRQSSSKTLECNNRREDLDTKNSLDISQTKKDDEAEKLPIKNAKIASIITDLEKRALIKSPRKSVTFEEKYEQKNEAQVITSNQEDCKATLMETEAPISLNVSDPIKANIEEKELYIYIDTMVDPANKLINKKRKLSEIEETVKEENIEPPNTETLTKQISSPSKRKRRHSSTATKCTKQTHSDSDSLSTFIKEQFQTSESDKDNIYIPIDLEQVENAVPIKPDYLETPPLIFTNNSAASTPSALHYEFSDFAGITETVETTPLENQDIFDLAFDPVATINSSPFQNTEDQYQFNPKYQDNVKDCISIPSTLSQDGAYQSIPVNTSQGLKAFTETFGDHSYADGVEALKTFQNRLPSNTIDTTISQSKDSPISGHSPTVVIESNNVETTLQYTSIADQEFRNSPRETTESPQLNPVYQGNPSNCIAVTSVPSTLCPATPCQVIPMDTMIGGTLESDRVLDFFTPSIGVPDSSSISESLVSGSLLDASNWDNDLFNYTDGMEGVDVGKNDYTDGMEGVDVGKNDYTDGMVGVDVGKNDYTDGMVGVDVGKNDYTDGMEGVDVGKNDYTDGMVGVDASNADHALRPSCGPVVPDFYLLAEPNVTMGVSDIEPPVETKKEEIVTPVKKVEEPEKELNFTKRNSRKKKVEPPPRKKGFQQALSSSRAKSGMIPNPGQLSPKDDIKKIPRVRRSTNYTSEESKGTARSHAIKLDSSAKEDSSGNSSTHAEKPRLESRQATKAFEQAVRETKSEAKPELDAFDKLKLEPTNPSFKFKNVGIKKHKDVKKPPREPTPPRKTTQKVQFPDDKNEGPYDWIQKITTKLKKDGKIESIYLAAPSYRT